MAYLILRYLIRFFQLEIAGTKLKLNKKVIGISGHFQNEGYISSHDFGFNPSFGKVDEAKDVLRGYLQTNLPGVVSFSDAIHTLSNTGRINPFGILFANFKAMEFNYLVRALNTRHLKLFNKSRDFLTTPAFYTCLGIGIIMNSFLIVVTIFLNKTFPKLKNL